MIIQRYYETWYSLKEKIVDFRGEFMKYYYRVYGLNIESTIEIPEFEVIDDISKYSIDVNLTYGTVNSEIKDLIERRHFSNFKKMNMWFYIKEVGIFHIFNGDTVIIEPCKDADLNMVKIYIMGSVLGMVLLQKNIVAIHGGGIVIDGKGCIFTGDKGAGKSTISTALRKKGYKFISDDVCSINCGDINKINYGFGYQKLCEDAMTKLGYDVKKYKPFRGDLNENKYIVSAFDEFIKEEVPLKAIFELAVEDVEKIEIKEIVGADKIKNIVANIFRVDILYYSGGLEPLYFRKCLEIAKNIKYYKITRPKSVFCVDDQIKLVENIMLKDKIIEARLV